MASNDDLFSSAGTPPQTVVAEPARAKNTPAAPEQGGGSYTAADIEVLEGLEPVRRRPGMYIGGTDDKAMHHLFAEVIDNAMDEAVAGFANWITVEMTDDGFLSVTDNGRGIPIDPHPKFPDKSALEVILTTLHSGGKFGSKAYSTSGGLHGVGVSVVNALSEQLEVEVARGQRLYRQIYSRGHAQSQLVDLGPINNRRGTRMRFKPDAQIFGEPARLNPKRIFNMARAKAYLQAGVEIRWICSPSLLTQYPDIPEKETFRFPGGLKDYLETLTSESSALTDTIFSGNVSSKDGPEKVEWALTWLDDAEGFVQSYCNTIPTPDGGTHENGLRMTLLRGLRTYADLVGNKKMKDVVAEDVMAGCAVLLSVFIREPEFQGQTKEKLSSSEAARLVDNTMRDAFDLWLAASSAQAKKLLDRVIERAEERMRRKEARDVMRKSATRKLRLPGKLADCTQAGALGAELFIVEGDSAGGSAKQARNRATQAVLPLRGKILNVVSAGMDKLVANQQLSDLLLALGCGTRGHYNDDDLRYERVIIMTDADVDGAHIASLLVSFFYQETPQLIARGHLYLAVPPLYRITHGDKTVYARDDAELEKLKKTTYVNKKIEIGRFKGLGEMLASQLRDTTMDPKNRTLLRVEIDREDQEATRTTVEELMGTKAEARFRFIQENATFIQELDV